MAELTLLRGETALVDVEDLPRLRPFNWRLATNGYVVATIERQTVYLHRFVTNAGPDDHVDHEFGDKLDNRKHRLRVCSVQQNAQNQNKQQRDTSSEYKGVARYRDRWQAGITVGGKRRHLGNSFRTEEAAAMAYDEAAIELFGKFAVLNFPREGYRCIEKKSSTTETQETTPSFSMAS